MSRNIQRENVHLYNLRGCNSAIWQSWKLVEYSSLLPLPRNLYIKPGGAGWNFFDLENRPTWKLKVSRLEVKYFSGKTFIVYVTDRILLFHPRDWGSILSPFYKSWKSEFWLDLEKAVCNCQPNIQPCRTSYCDWPC